MNTVLAARLTRKGRKWWQRDNPLRSVVAEQGRTCPDCHLAYSRLENLYMTVGATRVDLGPIELCEICDRLDLDPGVVTL